MNTCSSEKPSATRVYTVAVYERDALMFMMLYETVLPIEELAQLVTDDVAAVARQRGLHNATVAIERVA